MVTFFHLENDMTRATTDAEIRKNIKDLKPTITVGDGIFLKRLPSGNYGWRYNYTHGGKQKTISYGNFPQVCLAEARARHKETQRQRFELKDPMAIRAAERKVANTPPVDDFNTVAREWLDKQSALWTGKHRRCVENALSQHIFPVLGKLPITAIEPADVLRALKTLDDSGRHETAHRCHQRIDAIFVYAIATLRCKTNPAVVIKGALAPVVHVPMSAVAPDELPELIRRIDTYDGEPVTRLALRFMLLSFVRTGELIGARWSEFDFEAREWLIPAERMKRRLEHIVPLSRQAIEVLNDLKERTGNRTYVFSTHRFDKPMSNNTVLYALYRLGYHSRMTGHGFRAVASTILNELQANPDIIERQLAHVPENEVRDVYNRAKWIDQRHLLMQQWADHLDHIEHGGKVIPLRRFG